MNEPFFKENGNLLSLLEDYNSIRSTFGKNHENAIDLNNKDIDQDKLNTFLSEYMNAWNKLKTESTEILCKLL